MVAGANRRSFASDALQAESQAMLVYFMVRLKTARTHAQSSKTSLCISGIVSYPAFIAWPLNAFKETITVPKGLIAVG